MSAVIAATVTAGGAVVGGYLQSQAIGDAATKSSDAAITAARMQQEQYDQTRTDLSPYRAAGETALNRYSNYGQSRVNPGDYLSGDYGVNVDIYSDPSYQFRFNEMQRGIDRTAGAYGNLLSGNRLEEIMARSGEMASQEYANAYNRAYNERNFQYGSDLDRYNIAYGQETDYLNRLAGQVSTGLNAATQTGAFGANAAINAGNLGVSAANAQGIGQIGQANAIANTIGGLTSAYGMYAGYQANPPPIDTMNYNGTGGGIPYNMYIDSPRYY